MKRLVCVGDSITFGEHVPTSERWTTLLAEARPSWNVLTRAVCADTTRLALERYSQDVENARPAAVVIQFGHNDCNIWGDLGLPRVSLDAYEANLAEMVVRARAAGAEQITVCTPHRTAYEDGYEMRLAAYASAVRVVAMRQHATQLADAHAERERFDLLDGLHLSPKGHRQMADLIERVIG